ncbi:flagellar hook-basal body complex protein FliE [Salisediminibacterium halotolerans]|uniref:flagellar hook-basal body complex protein FliE n=1 Tax=Salisediminibacterium halotolerans TaxID=517425 RepID=UPI000F0DF1C0|nr:flagellar hook-basal body complex protein FliE [Salisediminibacterium halotolerans]RLJ74224.1 flagellar hook-basal body complex protein FliE [Actinophytocola xinjiangensis]RPE87683.1 flagellar hook-basal body complex protein FliE [Salisediminibacterium halotolerans]TWG35061.1 flagellar hook-basal body complex protein FliE [Salisediminibacterium halotolerans]GEL06652.1 hypothetical protein SHA02_00680 [Salisediminibacterium halotolerans]
MNMEQVQRMQAMPSARENNPVQNQEMSSGEAQSTFKTMLNEAVEDVNDKQLESKEMTEKMARGGDVDLHDVMISSQQASIALQTTIEVRDQIVGAYEEMMRMQV